MPVSQAGDAERAEFFRHWYPTMVKMGVAFGASHADAEDAASAVAICVLRSWTHWIAVHDNKYYLRKAIIRELIRIWKKHATQQARELRWAQDSLRSTPYDDVTDGYEKICEFEGVLQCLAISSPRQRELLSWLYLRQQTGWDLKEIADALGISQDTIRRHRQNARRTLKPFLTGDGHEHRRWLRAGERIHEEFHGGRPSPFSPRPIIRDAWNLGRTRGLDCRRGTEVVLLGPSELHRRRQQSPVSTRSSSLAELVDLATRNELLAVVLDADSIVLHRGGYHDALAAADQLGFLDGAVWDLDHAGVNAAGLAQVLGRPATVNRWEHTYPDQYGLCCVAIPIPTLRNGHIVLNLTATSDSLTSIPRAIQRQLHTIAQRWHHQLWTPTTHDQLS